MSGCNKVAYTGGESSNAAEVRGIRKGWNLLKDCVGILDGSYFRLKLKPYPDGRAVPYLNHSQKIYGLQATMICNDLGRIIHFTSLYPASVHDF